MKDSKLTLTCEYCGQPFFVNMGYKRSYKGFHGQFCSFRCADNWVLNIGESDEFQRDNDRKGEDRVVKYT